MVLHRLLVSLIVLVVALGVGCGGDGDSDGDGIVIDTDAGDVSGADGSGGGDGVPFPNIQSGMFASTSMENPNVGQTFYLSVIGLADQPNFCSQMPSTCDGAQPDQGKILAIRMLADQQHQTGRFPIRGFDEEAHNAGDTYATVLIDDYAGGSNAVATQGHVDVTTYDAQSIEGTYEFTLDGESYTGPFSADFCQNLQTQLNCP